MGQQERKQNNKIKKRTKIFYLKTDDESLNDNPGILSNYKFMLPFVTKAPLWSQFHRKKSPEHEHLHCGRSAMLPEPRGLAPVLGQDVKG